MNKEIKNKLKELEQSIKNYAVNPSNALLHEVQDSYDNLIDSLEELIIEHVESGYQEDEENEEYLIDPDYQEQLDWERHKEETYFE